MSTPASPPISDALAGVLRSTRDELNAAFVQARRQHPALDPAAFSRLLVGWLDPLVVAVHAHSPDDCAETVRAGYAVLLELAGQRILARSRAQEACFTRLLPQLAELVAADPWRVIGSLSNAAYNLDAAGVDTPGWLRLLELRGPACAIADQLLRLGQICAWRVGLAHYRSAALAALDELPASLTRPLFDAREQDWALLRGELARDPWYVPGATRQPRVAAVVGAFRGFGGLFVEPPRVCALGPHFLVQSGDAGWLLVADAFGATFHRASAAELAGLQPTAARNGFALEGHTLLTGQGRLELPLAGELTSLAHNPTTLALTSAFTHSVVLVALGGGP